MMEIVYGPVVLECLRQSAMFGVLFAIFWPMLMQRVVGFKMASKAAYVGAGLIGASAYGLVHLVTVCAADGFPPRIIQSTGLALLMIGLSGIVLLAGQRRHAAA